MTVLVLVVPIAALALLRRVFPLPSANEAREAFHFHDGAWAHGPQFPGGLWGLEISRQGVVWSIPFSRGGLCRLDGARWTRYGRQQFGTHTDWLRGGFALHDEEIWGAAGEGAVRFDGRSWRLYKDALKTARPAHLAAGSSGVWIIDDDGNLSHFDGSRWTIRSMKSVVPPAPSAGEHSRDYPPRLVMTGDGRLWLSWRGLWRQEGETWREVRSPGLNPAEAWPIGHDAENAWLWLWRTGEVAAVAPDGHIAARYGAREMGLTGPARFNRLAAANGRIWIASSSGLLTLGGGRWTNHGFPPECTTLTDVALAPDGSAWVMGETRSLARLARSYGPPLVACVIPLVLIGWLISACLQGRAENILATEPALAAAAGGVTGPAEINREARSARWKLCAMLAGAPFVVFGLDAATWRVWPGAPAEALRTGVVLFIVLACLLIWLRASRQGPSPRSRQAIWEPAKWMLFLSILLFCGLAPLDWVNRVVPTALARHVRLAVVALLATLIIFGRNIAAVLLFRPAWRAGDYDRALRWIRRLSFSRPTAMLAEMEGRTLALANRPADAEPCYRRALAKSFAHLVASRSDRAGLLGCLGEVLGDQGRDEEAKQCLQGSIEMGDNLAGSSRVDLAELLLERKADPLKALELIDEAMRRAKGEVAAKAGPWHSATRAWALSVLGRRQEAERAIEGAARVRRESGAALFANTHLNVGLALVAMDRPEEAIGHFHAAHEADRRGKYGAFALRQLERHGPARS